MSQTQVLQVPAWINIDEIVPAELRDDAAAVTAKLRAIKPELVNLCVDAVKVLRAIDEHTNTATAATRPLVDRCQDEGIWLLLMALSGAGELHDELGGIRDLFTAAADEKDDLEAELADSQ